VHRRTLKTGSLHTCSRARAHTHTYTHIYTHTHTCSRHSAWTAHRQTWNHTCAVDATQIYSNFGGQSFPSWGNCCLDLYHKREKGWRHWSWNYSASNTAARGQMCLVLCGLSLLLYGKIAASNIPYIAPRSKIADS